MNGCKLFPNFLMDHLEGLTVSKKAWEVGDEL